MVSKLIIWCQSYSGTCPVIGFFGNSIFRKRFIKIVFINTFWKTRPCKIQVRIPNECGTHITLSSNKFSLTMIYFEEAVASRVSSNDKRQPGNILVITIPQRSIDRCCTWHTQFDVVENVLIYKFHRLNPRHGVWWIDHNYGDQDNVRLATWCNVQNHTQVLMGLIEEEYS
jgi:hypothetical protein